MDQENHPPIDVLVIWVPVLREDHSLEAEKQKDILALRPPCIPKNQLGDQDG